VAGKALFKDFFRDYVEKELHETFDSQSDMSRSKLMARFFAERVLAPRNPTLLPFGEEELAACVVDGKGDQGVDYIARENNNVVIIQAKYSGGKKLSKRAVEDPADFEHFRSVLQRLRSYQSLTMCQPLREICAEIDWQQDTFQFYYITLRQLSTNQAPGDDHKLHQSAVPNQNVDDERVSLHLYNESKLNEELRDTQSMDIQQSRRASVRFTANQASPAFLRLASDDDDRSCYVGRISGAQLATLYVQQQKSRLFNLNIRNYLGDNATNKAIKKTATDSPEDFFFFNNGISALATEVTMDSSDPTKCTLLCENLSIINGAQTVRSLHKAHISSLGGAKDAQVLLRLTEIGSKRTKPEQAFLDNVTKYNNTQTAIRIADFRSNDNIQSDIAAKFSRLPAVDGKKFLYKNKRSGEQVMGVKTIGMEEYVKTIFAFSFGPDDVFGGTAHVFDATKTGGYTKLFGDGEGILPSLDEPTFQLHAGIWFLCSSARDVWREKTGKTDEPALERRWMFYFALHVVLRFAYSSSKRDLHTDLRRLANPSWLRSGQGDSQMKSIESISKVAFKGMIDSYKDESQKPGFAHRNWFRSASTLTSITEKIENTWEIVAAHSADYLLA
jgi:hypothetical protein